MKTKYIFNSLIVCIFVFCLNTITVSCNNNSELLLYYSFESNNIIQKDEVYTIKDLSGNGYDGISTESTVISGFNVINSVCGKGKAVCGAVKLPNTAFENINTSYTINFIGKYMVLDRTQKMLVLGNNYYSTPWGSGICRLSTYHENGERWVEYQCNLPSHNKVNMFTFICNEGTLDMYFNGNKIDKRYDYGDSSVIFSELAQDSENEFIVQNEYLDEFRLYNRALTDEEILMLYESVDLAPEPTSEPIATPTPVPTPTIEATIIPTETPTATAEPTLIPTTEPTVAPTNENEPKTEISLSIDNINDEGIMNCTLHNNTDKDIVSDCIVAVYNSNGELEGIKIVEGVPKNDTSLEFNNCSDISTVKVFLWESVTGMKPQIERLVYSV